MFQLDPERQRLSAGDIIKAADGNGALRTAVEELAGILDALRLGYKLQSFARRVVDGLFFDKAGESGDGARWAVYPKERFNARGGAEATPTDNDITDICQYRQSPNRSVS